MGVFVYRMAFESTKDQDLNDGSSNIRGQRKEAAAAEETERVGNQECCELEVKQSKC